MKKRSIQLQTSLWLFIHQINHILNAFISNIALFHKYFFYNKTLQYLRPLTLYSFRFNIKKKKKFPLVVWGYLSKWINGPYTASITSSVSFTATATACVCRHSFAPTDESFRAKGKLLTYVIVIRYSIVRTKYECIVHGDTF